MTKKRFIKRHLLWVLLWGMILYSVEPSLAGEGIVYPGKGVDDIRIGYHLPKKISPLLERRNITAAGPDGAVQRIKVSSPAFLLAVSLLRIKNSKMVDVLRFYGKGETDAKPDKIVIRYPSQGIDFEIDKASERVESVTIYQPVLPKFSVKQYQEQLQRK